MFIPFAIQKLIQASPKHTQFAYLKHPHITNIGALKICKFRKLLHCLDQFLNREWYKGKGSSVFKNISKEAKEKSNAPAQEQRQSLEELENAFLISVFDKPEMEEETKEFLRELAALSETYGFKTVEAFPCRVRKFEARTFIGKGKVEELAALAKEKGADVIIFDDEITPNQQKNLETAFGLPVIDRTELILEVFAIHAKTKEARLQIELAKVRYQMPRLKRMWTHLSRQRMSGGHLKGEGEKQIEIDRRILKRRISSLEREIEQVRHQRETKRQARTRSSVPTFAIIGYTNAGKSTLLNALTEADVLVEDKLFATLDTTSRQYTLPNHQQIILIDTVGFIRKLPHAVVAAFRSTLEEVCYTDILIHLIDVSHPYAIEHATATYEVLQELGIDESKPVITALNKVDKVENFDLCNQFRVKYPRTVRISAKTKEGFEEFFSTISDVLSSLRKVVHLRIPQSQYHLISEMIEKGNVITKEYEENDVIMEVEIPVQLEHKVEKYIQ